ncbi:uncharacterized protein AMSG_09414 [Thecamonas trahens ATCC 50062]|uniref:Topoisomerase 6 subunit A/Spo11 TOPRIM domain-containing protein n=1 Tax=Thecamonas trahens ATCC 50062 TaxID=461836 RepID=A0A0L0DLJ1_THETB|nr:hypothetical protein AMSG_09414 [Thecamonas trahens ATCC 50062]KNC53110.1 hypothetical protein AMSG_09414 [Thecamonas trahens ATCC 50062]|eukprot:XP_013754777.1 hypothetical protein AMSG_09414 [Thecamonas trahens ATCC 50062]
MYAPTLAQIEHRVLALLTALASSAPPTQQLSTGRVRTLGSAPALFVRVWLVLAHAYTAGLVPASWLTLRGVYYAQRSLAPHYFASQSVSNAAVDAAAAWLAKPTHMLHILPAARGLVVGPLVLDTDWTSPAPSRLAVSSSAIAAVPPALGLAPIFTAGPTAGPATRLLVVEKEAVFHRLASALPAHVAAAPGLALCTGKGFPDRATARLVAALACRGVRVALWTDNDPHGIHIGITYAAAIAAAGGAPALAHVSLVMTGLLGPPPANPASLSNADLIRVVTATRVLRRLTSVLDRSPARPPPVLVDFASALFALVTGGVNLGA